MSQAGHGGDHSRNVADTALTGHFAVEIVSEVCLATGRGLGPHRRWPRPAPFAGSRRRAEVYLATVGPSGAGLHVGDIRQSQCQEGNMWDGPPRWTPSPARQSSGWDRRWRTKCEQQVPIERRQLRPPWPSYVASASTSASGPALHLRGTARARGRTNRESSAWATNQPTVRESLTGCVQTQPSDPPFGLRS